MPVTVGQCRCNRLRNDLCREYCRDNMEKMQALMEGRAEIVTKQ
jgi:hypothetical protein